MKQYAKNFGDILIRDNKKLEKIEKTQILDKNKTSSQIKSLDQYNDFIRIGFWKMLIIIIIVVFVFMFTLISIRIFPKF